MPGTRQPKPLTVVWASVAREWTAALAESLAAQDFGAAAWEDLEGGPSRVEIFLDAPREAAAAAAALRRTGAAFGLALRIEQRQMPACDWAESWKRFFCVMRVSPRLVVRPPWEEYRPRDGEHVIVMDPGMSFGTGRHGTTQACLRFLDELAADGVGRSVLDLGCGSGILAIAAAKLGFAPVRGVDNDPEAVRYARANGTVNNVTATFAEDDLATCAARADIVVANVLAGVLGAHAARVAATVRPVAGHALLLSGILDSQYAAVRAAYAAVGFWEERTLLIDEWRSGWFVRATTAPDPRGAGRRAG
jgi:ribosomal protein L11 methyltransferase